ncbi:hypothetical protein MPSEU_001015600 [Mayamaea pseudoterrestris]|nr:hypothetical protein MPSEU_001015600 [Mayamaea pseudoterrestris]
MTNVIENDVLEGSAIPVIDLANKSEKALIEQIADACSTFGFFQVSNHGVAPNTIEAFRNACKQYFALPLEMKRKWRRNEGNARGFFDDELTKQRRDWKQCLDVGVPGSRDWNIPDDDVQNDCLDGSNKFPSDEELAGFREAVTAYFDECVELSHRLAILMAKGIVSNGTEEPLIQDLHASHTSYLRLNYYPVCDSDELPPPLGISPHKDAGFLTVLLQDDDCHSLQVFKDNQWLTMHPEPNTFTINTGDMAQVWSNGVYQAPLHRVLANRETIRYSAPFFYNPSYAAWVQPVDSNDDAKYHPVLWGYFRAVRFAGDLTDLGVEIQIQDFETSNEKASHHLEKQQVFATQARFDEPFSVIRYRPLLASAPDDDY